MLNHLLKIFVIPATSDEIAFRRQLTRFTEQHSIQFDGRVGKVDAQVGPVAGEVLLMALLDPSSSRQVFTDQIDVETVMLSAALACHGVARKAGLRLTKKMVLAAAFHLGARKPLTLAVEQTAGHAFDIVDEQRTTGQMDQQAVEIMVPRYIASSEPMVLDRLRAELNKQMHNRRVRRNLAIAVTR